MPSMLDIQTLNERLAQLEAQVAALQSPRPAAARQKPAGPKA
jgi:outer membrane murein-binding lipoprotein Lpp